MLNHVFIKLACSQYFHVGACATGDVEMGFCCWRYGKKKSRACPLRGGLCALWARGLFFVLVWAACAAGGRWGPVRGCRPSEAPSALPPDDPAGLAVYFHSHGSAFKGLPYPTIPRGLRGFCSGSFLAALGDLPPRRAMPSTSLATIQPDNRLPSTSLAAVQPGNRCHPQAWLRPCSRSR